MSTTPPSSEPRLSHTLRDDIRRRDLWQSISRDYRELRAFYIDDEKKARLRQMKWFRRALHETGWLLKSMLLRLTPGRRVLLFLGILLILLGNTVNYQEAVPGGSVSFDNWHLVGGLLLLFVLMLELKDKLLARDELEAGRKVQHALMPEESPAVEGWSVWLRSLPANEVGGDLVDIQRIAPERIGLAIGDVTGKGLRAALLMAKLQATLRALAPDAPNLAALAAKINQQFHKDSLPNIFASILYLEIFPPLGTVKFVNAGHFPPLLMMRQSIREAGKGEPALGLMPNVSYVEQTLEFVSGDLLVAYSDGLTEARNNAGEFYGVERLKHLLPAVAHRDAAGIGESILRSVEDFRGDAPASDDLSLLILKRS
jgi:hypothetical protein